jgi:hypothetical protein
MDIVEGFDRPAQPLFAILLVVTLSSFVAMCLDVGEMRESALSRRELRVCSTMFVSGMTVNRIAVGYSHLVGEEMDEKEAGIKNAQ